MMSKRQGARRINEIPPSVLRKLNTGELEAANLVEGLAIDFGILLKTVAPSLPRSLLCQMQSAQEEKLGVTQRMALAGQLLHTHQGLAAFEHYRQNPSDTVRGWAAYILRYETALPLKKIFQLVKPLADDPHFGVREWAWLAIRPRIVQDALLSIELLTPWTKYSSASVRRFASEATRPRGVWCNHLELLKQEPNHGMPILEPLRNDPSKYVQDSVANWLNDASKSSPEWVKEVCSRWKYESPTEATLAICKRGMRSLKTG